MSDENKNIRKVSYEVVVTKTTWLDKSKLWAPLKSKTPSGSKDSEYGGGCNTLYTEEYHEPKSVIETEKIEEEAYKQTVDNLDISALIASVNKELTK